MASTDTLEQAYNTTPYQSFPFTQTHPAHLYSIAKLFGLNPKGLERAKILELGCAGGGNIIPMAYHYPHAQFVGIDLAEKQIEYGLEQVKDLKLKNIELRHQSILDFTAAEGKFDYIICHGVYSWVSAEVQDKILKICRDNLSKSGIAYISYNTLPGWNMVQSIRELMQWHTKNLTDPTQKAQQARAILKFMSDGFQTDNSPYATIMREELSMLSRFADSYLLHEHLSSFNEPIYFYQFAQAAAAHKLSYLSDAYPSTMFVDNLPPQFAETLKNITDITTMNQYMDFIRNQRFRCSLLCHQEQKINRSLKTTDVEDFYLQLSANLSDASFTEADIGKKELSITNGNMTLKVSHPTSQLAILTLHNARHKMMHFKTLANVLLEKSTLKQPDIIHKHLCDELNIMRISLAGLIHLSSYPSTYSVEPQSHPKVCELARVQSIKQSHVTNRRHQTIGLDPLTKAILQHLDGTRDLSALVEIAQKEVEAGTLHINDNQQQPIQDKKIQRAHLEIACNNVLENIRYQALLVTEEMAEA